MRLQVNPTEKCWLGSFGIVLEQCHLRVKKDCNWLVGSRLPAGCWFHDNEDLKCLPLVMWAISSFGEVGCFVGYTFSLGFIFLNVVLGPYMGKHGLHDFFPSQNGMIRPLLIMDNGSLITLFFKKRKKKPIDRILGPWPISCLRAKL